jgi:hypothetical protein
LLNITATQAGSKISIIAPDRARNVEVIIRKRKIDLEKLRKACYALDEIYLDYGMIMSLLEIYPHQKEIELFASCNLSP